MAKKSRPKELSIKHQEFCKEYLLCMYATKAYMKVYSNDNYGSCAVSAHDLLKKPNIIAHIKELREKIEEVVGVSKEMVAYEHKKIGFSSFSNLLNGWMSQKEYSELPTEVIDCISSVETRTVSGEHGQTEEVKIKMYDKQKSLSELSKLFGYYDPEKVDLGDIGQIALFQIPSNNRDAKPES